MTYDLKITGGTIVDGSGKPGFAGDLGIKDGKVVALGKADGAADTTIDATGKVVSPGFVDVHTHYDAQILWDRMLSISPWHGVTTTVIGNCGFGVAPTKAIHRKLIMQTLEKVEGMSLEALEAGLGMSWPFETFPQYLDALEKRGSAINVAALFGHTPLRLYVMGEESTERAATADEIAAMKKLVREAMDAGAIGFGTSVSVSHNGYAGKPVPSRQATVEEMDALVSVMGELKRGLMQITIGRDFSTRHMAEVSRKYGVPVTWTALLSYLYGPGGHRKQLDLAAEQRKSGALVIPQVSCRPLNFEFTFAEPFIFDVMKFMNELAVEEAKAPGTRRRAYADPAWREKLRSEVTPLFRNWWDRVIIAWAPSARELEEQPLAAAAARLGKDPVDLALDLALANDLQARFRMAVMNFDEKEVAELITDPNTIIALVRRRRPCQPALRCLLFDLPARPLGPRAQDLHHRAGRSQSDAAAGRDVRHHRSRPAGRRPAGRRRGVRSQDGRARPAEARLRSAGRRRPAGVGGERHRRRDRQRQAHPPRRQGRRRGQRQAAGTPAASRRAAA